MDKAKQLIEIDKIKDHLANERTFLAWIRTSIGIMAFGFVLEKFSLFLTRLEALLTKTALAVEPAANNYLPRYTAIFGIVLVSTGAIMNVLAFIKYKQIRHQITSSQFKTNLFLEFSLTLIVFLIGLVLALYLANNMISK